jgi:hypothetical protein
MLYVHAVGETAGQHRPDLKHLRRICSRSFSESSKDLVPICKGIAHPDEVGTRGVVSVDETPRSQATICLRRVVRQRCRRARHRARLYRKVPGDRRWATAQEKAVTPMLRLDLRAMPVAGRRFNCRPTPHLAGTSMAAAGPTDFRAISTPFAAAVGVPASPVFPRLGSPYRHRLPPPKRTISTIVVSISY